MTLCQTYIFTGLFECCDDTYPYDFPGEISHETSDEKAVILEIENMTCMSCVRNIEGKMSPVEGVHSVQVDLENKRG